MIIDETTSHPSKCGWMMNFFVSRVVSVVMNKFFVQFHFHFAVKRFISFDEYKLALTIFIIVKADRILCSASFFLH